MKTNLVRRNVLAEDICEHCKQVPEDMIHAIWLFYGVLGVWESDLAWDFRHTKSFPKFLDLVQFIIDEGKDLAQFAMFIQTQWFRRNRLRVKDKPFPLSDVLPMAKQIQADYLCANLGPSPSPFIIQRDRVRWSAPISPLVKVNFDGAVFQDSGEASLGLWSVILKGRS